MQNRNNITKLARSISAVAILFASGIASAANLSVTPGTLDVAVGATATATVRNAEGALRVSTRNPATVSPSVSGSTVTVQGVSVGSTAVSIEDGPYSTVLYVNVVAATTTEDLSSGLRGIDANANGIRDDIDNLIATKFSQTPATKKAAEQKARALQALMEATTKDQAYAAMEKIGKSTNCIFEVLPENTIQHQDLRNSMSKEIEALTANTRERFVKYWDSSKLLGGGYFADPVGPACE